MFTMKSTILHLNLGLQEVEKKIKKLESGIIVHN